MKKEQFTSIFLGFITKKIDVWLPEEGIEEEMLDVMQRRLKEHNAEIRDVLVRND